MAKLDPIHLIIIALIVAELAALAVAFRNTRD